MARATICCVQPTIVMSEKTMTTSRETWYILERDFILGLLYRSHAGENPDILIIEVEANCNTTEVEDDDG